MKKIILSLLFIFVSLFATGCTNPTVNRDLRKAGLSFTKDKFDCLEMFGGEDYTHGVIRFFNGSHAITNTYDLFEISMDKPFSNDKFCRKNEKIKVDGIFNGYIVRDLSGKLYYLFDNEYGTKFTEINYKTDNNANLYKLFMGDRNIIKVQNIGNNSYYVLKNDGNIYNYIVSGNQKYYKIVKTTKIYTKESYEGNILDFYYDGDESPKTFVKTAHAYFRNIILNKEECEKYSDVKCVYEFGKDEKFSKNYDYIIAFDGTTLITDYLQLFTTQGNADVKDNNVN